MSERSQPDADDRSVADALRDAVERTLAATAPAASQARERAGDLLDEITQRGREAGSELGKRGQEAQVDLLRRGQEASAELAKQLEALEKRLASIEERLRESNPPPQG